MINHDLENYPLELKIEGSSVHYIDFFASDEQYAGGIVSDLSRTYRIVYCNNINFDFPTTLPIDPIKVWRLTLIRNKEIRLQMHCNEDMVVDFLISNSSCPDYPHEKWNRYWKRKVANIIPEYNSNTSYAYYRHKISGQYDRDVGGRGIN